MASHVIDSAFFADQYGEPEMRRIFSDGNLLQRWLDAEAALARAEAACGIVPEAAAREIGRQARAENLDMAALRRGIDETFHPIVPLIHELAQRCAGDAGQWIHWGATTQDIMDTATALQLKEAYGRIAHLLDGLTAAVCDKASAYRDTPMAGRTHGQHALPVTFGYKLAVWAVELTRHRERLSQSRPRVLMGQFSGAVGTLASLGEVGLQVQRRMMAELGLEVPPICWHASRDGPAEFLALMGLCAATAAKMAHEVADLQKTEVAEVEEPFHMGKVGSSTMPHKRNPMMCEAAIAAASVATQVMPLGAAAMTGEHERDMGRWQIEWAALPQAAVMTAGALALLTRVLRGLRVDAARMRRNLEMNGGVTGSETVMLHLARHVGRQRAHDIVYAAAMRAADAQRPLGPVLAEDAAVSEHLSPAEIDADLRPDASLGLAGPMVDQALGWIGERRRALGLPPLQPGGGGSQAGGE